ncbi:MAG: hypothetical protein PHF79_01680 [Candidatus Pacebacteria bacterium]|nr:hypothetical protein [Candidatus Paceibacterota bacterium]
MTYRSFSISLSILIALFVFGFNYIAHIFYFFWTLNGIDSFLHLAAGFSIGLFATAIFDVERIKNNQQARPSRFSLLVYSVISALFIGILWEIYEYSAGITLYFGPALKKTLLDTGSDIFMDIAGGFAGFLLYWKYSKKIIC